MQISKILIDFINDARNKELLNEFKFKQLYKELNGERYAGYQDKVVSEFTALMYAAKIDPLLYLDEVPEKFLQYNTNVKNVDIPSNIISIGECAFYGCSSLTSITIPNSVTSIGDHAFYYCISLTSITIPDSVISIGVGAFSSCRSLKSITIPDGVMSIDTGTFDDCSSLTSVIIPSNITSIGKSMFWLCYELKAITYRGTKQQWNAIHKDELWKDNSDIKTIHCIDGDINVN